MVENFKGERINWASDKNILIIAALHNIYTVNYNSIYQSLTKKKQNVNGKEIWSENFQDFEEM